MAKSGYNWKWPIKDDILHYDLEDIVSKIEEPKCLSNRGIYQVPEI